MGEEDEEKDSDAGEKPGTAGRVQEEKQGRNKEKGESERLTPFPFLFFHPLAVYFENFALSFLGMFFLFLFLSGHMDKYVQIFNFGI